MAIKDYVAVETWAKGQDDVAEVRSTVFFLNTPEGILAATKMAKDADKTRFVPVVYFIHAGVGQVFVGDGKPISRPISEEALARVTAAFADAEDRDPTSKQD
jgi:hypothetical protein